MKANRRTFLRTIGLGTGVTALSTQFSAVQASTETTTMTGRIVNADGSPAAEDMLYISGGYTHTDAEGYFEETVETNASYTIGYYKAQNGRLHAPVQNGAPHIYRVGRFSVASEPRDLGEISLPEAQLIQVRAVDSNREPLVNARPGFGHGGYGSGNHQLSTNEDGFFVIEGAEFTGVELAGVATISMAPPEGDRFQNGEFSEEITVREGLIATFVFNESGLEAFETSTGESDDSESDDSEPDEPEKTDESTEADGDQSSEPATDDSGTGENGTDTESEGTPPEETESDDETGNESDDRTQSSTTETTGSASSRLENSSTPHSTESDNRSAAGSERETESPATRGFFSNDNDTDESAEFLTDPFVLTVGGFVLSAAGITVQLLRGK